MIILGVDPGLTRCGVGVIEAGANRRLSFIHVDVVRSDPHTSQDLRLLTIYNGLCSKMDRFIPDAVSIERVFAQSNRNTVLGTAQAAGMAMLAAAQRGIPVALHTPTEAKLAITGNGKAEKIQIERMVAKVLGLNALFAFTGGLLGMHLAWKYPSRHVAIAGFALQFVALIVLALVGQPHATAGIVLAIAMLGLWLFAEGFGPGAQLMIYPALSYPTAIRATGVGFSRALSGIGSALALFILPLLQASLGTQMFWVVSLAAIIPIFFLLAVRHEPTREDIDALHE